MHTRVMYINMCVLLINLRMNAHECAGDGRKAVSCWRPLSLLPPEIHGAIRHCSRCLDGLSCSLSCTSTADRNKLQHTAYCNVLYMYCLPQQAATHCNTSTAYCNILYIYCLLQHIATHCNTLQHTATHCNTWQNTAAHNICGNMMC